MGQNAGQSSHARGLAAEDMAADYLTKKKYKIIARRYKTPHGEIDLIALHADVTVFIEVKSRQDQSTALESITPRMKSRIMAAGGYYLASQNLPADSNIRFDVIAVHPSGMDHIENAFMD